MNIYDIAREAGVSIATISRVVNGKSVVSGKTREKVEAVLKKYNYTPDPTARSLVVKSTKTAAILAEDIRSPYCAEVCYTVERELSRIGYTAVLYSTGGTALGVSQGIRTALARRADAILISGISSVQEDDILLAAKSVPVILTNHLVEAENVYSVICDEIYGMMLAVGQFAGTGRYDIIYVQDGDEGGYSTQKLAEGFEAGMAMNDLTAAGHIVKTERGFEGGFACAQALLREGQKFNAVVCGSDTTAAGFIRCLNQNDFDVPEDLSVISINNTPATECLTPSLTTVDCRADKVGASAAKVMSALLEGKGAEIKNVILPRLVLRESA